MAERHESAPRQWYEVVEVPIGYLFFEDGGQRVILVTETCSQCLSAARETVCTFPFGKVEAARAYAHQLNAERGATAPLTTTGG